MTGNFVDSNFHGRDVFSFPGQGFVTLDLTLAGNPEVGPFYALQSMHFDFINVPEPGTMALIGTVIAGLAVCALKKTEIR
jgi:hypothetical protein